MELDNVSLVEGSYKGGNMMESTGQIKSIDEGVVVTSDGIKEDLVDTRPTTINTDASVIKTFGGDGTVDIAYVESKMVERELYPKSNCKRCFGRGVIGFDRITKTVVICECIKKIYRDVYETQFKGVKPEETGLILMIEGERFKIDNNYNMVKV